MAEKNIEQLINNIIGQLNGIKTMIDTEKNCSDVICQIKAVKSAFNNVLAKYLEENLVNCLGTCQKNKKVCQKIFTEISKF